MVVAPAAILESVGFNVETHPFPRVQLADTCGHVALAFLRATLAELGERGFSDLRKLNLGAMLPAAVSMVSAHELSKAPGDDRTYKDATSVDWLNTGGIATLQEDPVIQHWPEQCHVKILYPMSGRNIPRECHPHAPTVRNATGSAVLVIANDTDVYAQWDHEPRLNSPRR